MLENEGYCRDLALSEPLAGSATEAVTRWVLLEDGDPWGRKPPRDSCLPEPVSSWLIEQDARPDTRVQLIRKPGASRGPTRRLFVVDAPEQASGRRVVELNVELAALPTLDLDRAVGRAVGEGREHEAPLWLVCTHGTRDRCCAKWGIPVWDALAARAPDRVWQSSHLGGHRFAPTLVVLPAGLMWGRLELDELAGLWTAAEDGQLTALERLRGRCCHPRPVQAAESMLRLAEGLEQDEALRLAAYEILGDERFRVSFELGSGEVRSLELRRRVDLQLLNAGSCGDPLEPRARYELA